MAESSDLTTLIGQLTLEEKASLCLGADFWHTAAVPRLGIPAITLSDGPHGLRRQPDQGDHIGLSGSLPATCFPTASALGSSFDPELARRIGTALAEEALAQGVAVVLGPGVNIKRSPLCGRNFEYLSEDPLVAGVLGTAMVQGLQAQGIGASVKHYAANNQETDRLRVSADVDERTLREIYLPAFERIVLEAGPWTVMCAYNRVNGVHASQNRWLLTEVLRDEWGFDGLVMSDWGAVHDRVPAVIAGLDLEMPPNLGVSDAAIVAAVRAGQLEESVLDQVVTRVLQLVDRSLADGSLAGPDRPATAEPGFDVDGHHALARLVAAECAVLLKNDGGLLPLEPDAGDTVVVIGEFARTPRYQGAGSSQVNPTRLDIPLDELRVALPDGVDVVFAAGYDLSADLGEASPAAGGDLADEAVALAARAGTVIAFLGLPAAEESEGFDRTHLRLPADQLHLVARLAEANPRLVVVLANGSVVQLAGWDHLVPAILECWLSGQASGGAVADLLMGAANPSGRLAETIPLRLEDHPSTLNFPGELGHVRYGEGVFVGYRGLDAVGAGVSYPFGHGLSYTSFEYGDPEVTVTGTAAAGDLEVVVTCEVANTGDRPGKEVVQLYVAAPQSAVSRPPRELRAFEKLAVQPGESATATFRLGARDLSYWSTPEHRWVLQGGVFGLSVGASSRDLRSTMTVEISPPPVRATLDGMATLEEWLADPVGARLLRDAFGVDDDGRARGLLGEEELLPVIGNFPISTLAAFPGMGLDHARLADVLEQLAVLEQPAAGEQVVRPG